MGTRMARDTDYTASNFDPASLRVVDLKHILTQHGIVWSSKDRKADLIKIFKEKLIPQLQAAQTPQQPQPHQRSRPLPKLHSNSKSKTTHKASVTKSKIHKPSQTADDLWKSQIVKSDVITTPEAKKNLKIRPPSGEKRKYNEIGARLGDTTYQNQLQKGIKRKRTVGKQEHAKKTQNLPASSRSPSMNSNTPNDSSTRNLFDRSSELKFDLAPIPVTLPVSPSVSTSTPLQIDDERLKHLRSKTSNEINQTSPIANSTFNDLDRLQDTSTEDDTVLRFEDAQRHRYDHSHIPTIASAANSTKLGLNNTSTHMTPMVSKHALAGPTMSITNEESDTDSGNISETEDESDGITDTNINTESQDHVKVKLEKTDSSRQETSVADGTLRDEYPTTTNLSGITSSLNNHTFDNDSVLLSQLQNEFEIENSKIEIEAEKVLNKVKTRELYKFYKPQFLKIIAVWASLMTVSFVGMLYRHERIRTGFCGHELANADTIFHMGLECVKCPPHAICSENSQITCLPDYIVSKPPLWSLFGLIPTFNKCVLDSTKIKRINKIVKAVVDLLSIRNANYRCGDGGDEEVGLNWDQIREIINQRLMIDPNDTDYAYYWGKVKLLLTTRTDLKFIESGSKGKNKDDFIIRSTSLSRLSIKCRLKKLLITILLKYKVYLLSITAILILFSYTFYKINELQTKNETYRRIVKDVFDKLQKQRRPQSTPSTGKKQYIAKIQLRDYYLPQMHNLSKKNRRSVWNKVVKAVESNSNVHAEEIEVNGEIMRVWTWSSDIH